MLWENGLLEEDATSFAISERQGELFDDNNDRQLSLNLEWSGELEETDSEVDVKARKGKDVFKSDNSNSINNLKPSRRYSSGQRSYLAQLEQGDYNTYAGGLLFAPLFKTALFSADDTRGDRYTWTRRVQCRGIMSYIVSL